MIVRGYARQTETQITRGLRQPIAAWQLLTVLTNWGLPAERLTSVVTTDLSPITLLGSIVGSLLFPAEYQTSIQQSAVSPLDWWGQILDDTISPVETLVSGREDTTMSQEWLTCVLSSTQSPVTISGSITRVFAQSTERLGGVTQSRLHPSEYLSGLTTITNHPVSVRSLVDADCLMPVELIKNVVEISRSSLSPIEILSWSQIDNQTPVERSAVSMVTTLFPIQLSYRTSFWVTPGPGCWTVLARDVTMTVLSPDITMSVESP